MARRNPARAALRSDIYELRPLGVPIADVHAVTDNQLQRGPLGIACATFATTCCMPTSIAHATTGAHRWTMREPSASHSAFPLRPGRGVQADSSVRSGALPSTVSNQTRSSLISSGKHVGKYAAVAVQLRPRREACLDASGNAVGLGVFARRGPQPLVGQAQEDVGVVAVATQAGQRRQLL